MYAHSESCYATVPKRVNSKKRKDVEHLDSVCLWKWYDEYKKISESLESKLEELNKSLHENLENDITRFIENYKYSQERIPTISIFTGINLPDHDLVFSMITDCICESSKVQAHIVFLNPSKATTLKSLIENTVFNFVNNCDNDKTDASLHDEDALKPLKKSKCTLLRLVDWYNNNYDSKETYLIIVISDIGAYPGRMLDEFMQILSVFRDRLPFMFLIGVPTTLHTIHKTFSNDVLSKLSIHLFQSQPSKVFLDKVLEEVFLTSDCLFQLGSKVFEMLTELFLNYNFSVKEFIKGVKLCLMEHFFHSNFSLVCCASEDISEKVESMDEEEIARLLKLPSMSKNNSIRKMENRPILTASTKQIKKELKKLRVAFGRSLARFHLTIRCLHLLLKCISENSLSSPMREIYIQVMNQEKRTDWLDKHFMHLNFLSKETLLEALINIRDLLDTFTEDKDISTVHLKIIEHIEIIEKSQFRAVGKSPAKSPVKIDIKPASRRDLTETLRLNASKNKTFNEFDLAKKNVLSFLRNEFFKVHLKSIDDIPLQELFFFNDAKVVQRLLDGVPRTAINHALKTPHFYLNCKCCKLNSADDILPTMPDLSIVYKLHTESGNQVNLFDWFQQFRVKVDKEDFTDQEISPEIYGRFVHAVKELHFLGFISQPKRKASNNAEYVTKWTF